MTAKTEKPNPTTALITVESFDKRYPDNKYNQLVPSKTIIETVQQFSKLSVETVTINPDPQQQEVFVLGMTKIVVDGKEKWVEKLSPTKTALDKLWFAMGIESVSGQSGRVDDRSNKDYFEYVVVARITKPDGSKMEVAATKMIDVQAYVEEMYESLSLSHELGNLGEYRTPTSGTSKRKVFHKFTDAEADRHIAKKTRSREIEMRKHGLQLAETGARNRLVRMITNLKPWYTAEELGRPFVVIRIDRDVKELAANPQTRGEIYRRGSHARDLAYPSERGDGNVSITPLPHIQDAEFSDAGNGEEPEQQEPAAEAGPDNDPEFKRKEFEAQMRDLDITARFRQMQRLIEKRQIKAGDTNELIVLDVSDWEKKKDEAQVKNLMWAYDQPKPNGLPY